MRRFLGLLPAALLALHASAQTPEATPTPAPAPPPKPPAMAMVKVNDDTWIRLGFLLQPQADWLQTAAGGYGQNLFVRRVRVLLGGSLTKDVTFFFETDTPNLGKTVAGTKTGATMTVQDAFVEWKVANEFQLGGGLFLVPLARNTLQSAASLLTLDYGTYSFSFSAPLQNVVGRDTGFHARGYFLGNHLEYRAGIFQGQRDAAGRQAFRVMGRVMYDLFDTETGYFYTGTNLGKKKIVAFGTAFDAQKDYFAYAGDAFVDWPIAGGNAVTFQADFIHYNGGRTLTALPNQDTLHTEAGVYIGAAKVTPYGIFELKDVHNTDTGDEKRYGIGLAWFRNGHNFNIKAQYLKIDPTVGPSLNQFTVQMQGFFF